MPKRAKLGLPVQPGTEARLTFAGPLPPCTLGFRGSTFPAPLGGEGAPWCWAGGRPFVGAAEKFVGLREVVGFDEMQDLTSLEPPLEVGKTDSAPIPIPLCPSGFLGSPSALTFSPAPPILPELTFPKYPLRSYQALAGHPPDAGDRVPKGPG